MSYIRARGESVLRNRRYQVMTKIAVNNRWANVNAISECSLHFLNIDGVLEKARRDI